MISAAFASASARLPRHLALCCDYDGTLAHDGVVSAATLRALERVAASGRRLVLVTGRELGDLRRVFAARAEPDGVPADGRRRWLHHLRRHDYSAWIERQIKDPELLADVLRIEDSVSDPARSRAAIRAAIERRYTAAG